MAQTAALEGLKVLDFSVQRVGAQASQTLAAFGAEVVMVEPLGGSPLRAQAAWPFLARGKLSIQLNLKDYADLERARSLATAMSLSTRSAQASPKA